jgi:hypothetical protein
VASFLCATSAARKLRCPEPPRTKRLEHFFEEVDTGSSKENAVNQELRAVDLIESDRQPL